MKKDAFFIGIIILLAVFSGVATGSLRPVIVFCSIALFFSIWAFLSYLSSRKKPIYSRIRNILAISFIIIYCSLFFVSIFLGAERIYVTEGSSYPSFLSKEYNINKIEDFLELKNHECKGKTIEIYTKDNNKWLIRCGFLWPLSHTYISNTDPSLAFDK